MTVDPEGVIPTLSDVEQKAVASYITSQPRGERLPEPGVVGFETDSGASCEPVTQFPLRLLGDEGNEILIPQTRAEAGVQFILTAVSGPNVPLAWETPGYEPRVFVLVGVDDCRQAKVEPTHIE